MPIARRSPLEEMRLERDAARRADRDARRADAVGSLDELDFLDDMKEDARMFVEEIARDMMDGAEVTVDVVDGNGSFRVSVEKENFDYWRRDGRKPAIPCFVPGVCDDNRFFEHLVELDEKRKFFLEEGIPFPVSLERLEGREDLPAAQSVIRHHLEDSYGREGARRMLSVCEERARRRLMEEVRPTTRLEFDFEYDLANPGVERSSFRGFMSECVTVGDVPDFGSARLRECINRVMDGHSTLQFGMEAPRDRLSFVDQLAGMAESFPGAAFRDTESLRIRLESVHDPKAVEAWRAERIADEVGVAMSM